MKPFQELIDKFRYLKNTFLLTFKIKNKSTVTAGLLLQSLITRALEDDNFVALASIDLSAAFDIVDVDLLIKRLVILGLPNDVVKLIEIWLKERYFYVSVNGSDSMVKVTWYGIVQGSILGPILYAIFISPTQPWWLGGRALV